MAGAGGGSGRRALACLVLAVAVAGSDTLQPEQHEAAASATAAIIPAEEEGKQTADQLAQVGHHATADEACSMCADHCSSAAACRSGDCGDGSNEFCWWCPDNAPPAPDGYKSCGSSAAQEQSGVQEDAPADQGGAEAQGGAAGDAGESVKLATSAQGQERSGVQEDAPADEGGAEAAAEAAAAAQQQGGAASDAGENKLFPTREQDGSADADVVPQPKDAVREDDAPVGPGALADLMLQSGTPSYGMCQGGQNADRTLGPDSSGYCAGANTDTHAVCVTMPSDFCAQTGQDNWCAPYVGGGWCVCMWAYATYVEKHGCESLQAHVSEMDLDGVCGKYTDDVGGGGKDLTKAKECLGCATAH